MWNTPQHSAIDHKAQRGWYYDHMSSLSKPSLFTHTHTCRHTYSHIHTQAKDHSSDAALEAPLYWPSGSYCDHSLCWRETGGHVLVVVYICVCVSLGVSQQSIPKGRFWEWRVGGADFGLKYKYKPRGDKHSPSLSFPRDQSWQE